METVEGYRKEHPAYGSPHPDTDRWPHHFFCFAQQQDPTGAVFNYYYAAAREFQDLYNWEHTTADIGRTKFDAVKRSYITLRTKYDSVSPAMGTAMPNMPADKFDGLFIMSERTQVRIPVKELDSLFILDQQTYVRKVMLAEGRYDEHVGRGNGNKNFLYYRGECPPEYPTTKIEDILADPTHPYWGLEDQGVIRNGDQLSENWFAIKEGSVIAPNATNTAANPAKKRIITRTTPLSTDIIFIETGTPYFAVTPAYGDPHYDTINWPHHKLCFIVQNTQDLSGLMSDYYYVADRTNQYLYNLETSLDSLPNTFGNKSYKRTYLLPRGQGTPELLTFDPLSLNLVAGTYPEIIELKRTTGLTGNPILDSLYERTVIECGNIPVPKTTTTVSKVYPEKYLAGQTSTNTKTLSTNVLAIGAVANGQQKQLTVDGNVYTLETVQQATPVTLTGSSSYTEREPMTITEQVVAQGTAIDVGDYIFSSQVTPIGNGLAIKTTATADGLGPYYGQEWDDTLGVGVAYVEYYARSVRPASSSSTANLTVDGIDGSGAITSISIVGGGSGYPDKSYLVFNGYGSRVAVAYIRVNPSTGTITSVVITDHGLGYGSVPTIFLPVAAYGPYTHVQPINRDRYLVRTYTVPDVDFLSYSYKGTINVDFPPELISVDVLWEKNVATGDFISYWDGYSQVFGTGGNTPDLAGTLSGSERGSSDSNAYINPIVTTNLRHKQGRFTPSVTKVFYAPLELSTSDAFLDAHVDTHTFIPTVELTSGSIVCAGQKVTVNAEASVNATYSNRIGYSGNNSKLSYDTTQGVGSKFDVQTQIQVVNIPPCVIAAVLPGVDVQSLNVVGTSSISIGLIEDNLLVNAADAFASSIGTAFGSIVCSGDVGYGGKFNVLSTVPVINATDLQLGVLYTILTEGTTFWLDFGAPNTYVVGTQFVATAYGSVGSGTGTATAGSVFTGLSLANAGHSYLENPTVLVTSYDTTRTTVSRGSGAGHGAVIFALMTDIDSNFNRVSSVVIKPGGGGFGYKVWPFTGTSFDSVMANSALRQQAAGTYVTFSDNNSAAGGSIIAAAVITSVDADGHILSVSVVGSNGYTGGKYVKYIFDSGSPTSTEFVPTADIITTSTSVHTVTGRYSPANVFVGTAGITTAGVLNGTVYDSTGTLVSGGQVFPGEVHNPDNMTVSVYSKPRPGSGIPTGYKYIANMEVRPYKFGLGLFSITTVDL